MEQLNLSSRETKSSSRWKDLFWPDVSNEVQARSAAKNGMYACIGVAVLTAVLVALGSVQAPAIFDSILFAALGFSISRMSRIGSVCALLLYLTEIGYGLVNRHGGTGIGIIAIIVTAILISSVRASFPYHKLRKLPPELPGSDATVI